MLATLEAVVRWLTDQDGSPPPEGMLVRPSARTALVSALVASGWRPPARLVHLVDGQPTDPYAAAEGAQDLRAEVTRLTDEVAGLRQALRSRDRIGQAKGILMERLQIGPDDAFALLVSASQRTNTPLRDVADALASTRELPETRRR